MLDNPIDRQKAARAIARDVMRGDDGDPLGELDPLAAKMFRNARVNLQVPILDPVVARRVLIFLSNELPALVAEMDRVRDRRSKSLLVEGRLRRWNWAFAKWAGK